MGGTYLSVERAVVAPGAGSIETVLTPQYGVPVLHERGAQEATATLVRWDGSGWTDEQEVALGVVSLTLLTIIAVALVVIALNSQRLVVEQQRTTCYARLSWLAPGEAERPFRADRIGRLEDCEGRSPLIEFQDSP